MLRNVIGSKIPVELYHFPDEFTDADARKQLEEYDIALKTIQAPRSSGDKAWNKSISLRTVPQLTMQTSKPKL